MTPQRLLDLHRSLLRAKLRYMLTGAETAIICRNAVVAQNVSECARAAAAHDAIKIIIEKEPTWTRTA